MAHLQQEISALQKGLARASRADVRLRPILLSGNPADEIAKFARGSAADLVVIGKRGVGSFKTLLLGSTAERVVRACPALVLVVNCKPLGPYQKILVAIPPDRSQQFVIEASLCVMAKGAPRVDLVTAINVPLEGWLWSGWVSTKEIFAIKSATRDRARKDLPHLIASYRQAGIPCQVTAREGDPRQIILAAAAKIQPEIIVVGTHAGKGAVLFHLGSVSAHVIEHASCDVLVASPCYTAATK